MENQEQLDLIGFRERTTVFGQQKNQQSSRLLSFLVESLALEFSYLRSCSYLCLSLCLVTSLKINCVRLFLFPQSNS